jgi:5-methylcytosine-specific restriction endonuclease McrA
MSRSVPLWVGKTDDSPIPPRVRLRVFERDGGICWISGRKIQAGEPWDLDHKIALCNGGTHSEDNLAPALRDKHREKTKLDVKLKSKVARVSQSNLGIKRKPSRSWGYGKDSKFKMKIGGGIVPR